MGVEWTLRYREKKLKITKGSLKGIRGYTKSQKRGKESGPNIVKE